MQEVVNQLGGHRPRRTTHRRVNGSLSIQKAAVQQQPNSLHGQPRHKKKLALDLTLYAIDH